QLPGSAHQDQGALRGGRGGGRGALVAAVRAARPRVLVRPDAVHRGVPGAPDRPGGDLRAGAVGADLPDAGRGGGEGEQHPVRAVRGGLDREGLPDPVDGAADAGRRGVGEHLQPVRPGVAVGRVKGVGLRPGGRPARPGRVPRRRRRRGRIMTSKPADRSRPDTDTDTGAAPAGGPAAGAAGSADEPAAGRPAARLEVRKTYKLYVNGAFPRSESGRSYEIRGAGGECLANAAQASRKDVRDAVRAARAAFGGWSAGTAYHRGLVLYRVAELLEGRRAQFVAEVAASEGLTGRRAEA